MADCSSTWIKTPSYSIETWVATFGRGAAGLDNLITGVMPRRVA